ncbi:MAG TPA: methyltransferase domain-containing protein [Planctomycetota bacterium]|nr:methyltransferase domain-containing protein [Planctomycetota bacterium]
MLPVRGARGYAVYAAGMEASAADKAKLLRFIRPGVIAELGCGTGTVLELLRRKSPRSRLIGVDGSPEMIRRCRRRFPGLELRREDITERLFEPESIDTIVLCSIMHEVFSYKGYDYSAVRRTLNHCARALRRGGRLILRDGVKPALQDAVYLTFLNAAAHDKFVRFSREFGSSEIVWRLKDQRIQVARRDAMEFLTKYIYDVNWSFEVKEQFGVFTLADWAVELRKAGLRVLYRQSYLIPWLKTTHWSKDVLLEIRTPRGYRKTEYPDSTMLMAAEK